MVNKTTLPVAIGSTKTIGDLKKLIKAEKANNFQEVDVDTLTPWKVSIPVVPKKERKISLADVPSKEELDETDDITDAFGDFVPKNTTHVMSSLNALKPKHLSLLEPLLQSLAIFQMALVLARRSLATSMLISMTTDGVVQNDGKLAVSVAWLDDYTPLSILQQSNYRHIIDHKYIIDSAHRQGKLCDKDGCTALMTWRNVMIGCQRDRLYYKNNRLCETKDRIDKHEDAVRRTHQIEGDLLSGLVRQLAPNNEDQAQFNSRESVLNTVMTVAVQGFCAGQAMYNPQEQFHLRVMAREANPTCFWNGVQLSITARCPKNKFTVERTIFHQGKVLRYGAENQILVAASQFANCFFMNRIVDERIRYLEKIEQGWEAGLEWADHAIEEL
ncbi:hypothetical protein BGW41_003692 [Actinomortierella wolfii]|nr:hypothetical protein BGW41_003692 [Actinomortierella wolfii]